MAEVKILTPLHLDPNITDTDLYHDYELIHIFSGSDEIREILNGSANDDYWNHRIYNRDEYDSCGDKKTLYPGQTYIISGSSKLSGGYFIGDRFLLSEGFHSRINAIDMRDKKLLVINCTKN